jgi:acetyl esterase/lipase
MTKYNIHQDFAFLRFVPNTRKWMIPAFNALFKWHFKSTKAPQNIEVSSHNIKGFEDKDIEVLVFKPQNIPADAPCLVYCHGGGFFIEAAQVHKKMMFEYAEKANCIIVFPKYVSPLQRTDLKGLPPAYIETAEFDCLRDEGLLYAQRLKETGISVALNQTKGTIHAFDLIEKSSITQDSIQRRVTALRQAFGEQK